VPKIRGAVVFFRADYAVFEEAFIPGKIFRFSSLVGQAPLHLEFGADIFVQAIGMGIAKLHRQSLILYVSF
jgi:hypothetical protein